MKLRFVRKIKNTTTMDKIKHKTNKKFEVIVDIVVWTH